MAREVFLYHPGPCPLPIPRCGEPPNRALLLASDPTPAVSPPASLPDSRRTSKHRLRHFLAEKDRTRHSNPSSIMPSMPRNAFFQWLVRRSLCAKIPLKLHDYRRRDWASYPRKLCRFVRGHP